MTTTWTPTPAGLLGLGGSAMPACTDIDLRSGIGVSPAPRVAPVQGTGVPAGSAARLRPVVLKDGAPQTVVQTEIGVRYAFFAHNSIDGTTLGSHPSSRPLS
jgi:hypothetical protein